MPASTLSAIVDTARQEGKIVTYLMAASKAIYKGAKVGLASGLAQPFVDASGQKFAGVAVSSVTSAASGNYYVEVWTTGVHEQVWYDDDAVAVADLLCEVYAASDADVSPNATASSATKEVAYDVKCGRLVGINGTKALVKIDGYC